MIFCNRNKQLFEFESLLVNIQQTVTKSLMRVNQDITKEGIIFEVKEVEILLKFLIDKKTNEKIILDINKKHLDKNNNASSIFIKIKRK